jgi:hypothetical protein
MVVKNWGDLLERVQGWIRARKIEEFRGVGTA